MSEAWQNVAVLLAGIAMLVVGGRLLVDASVNMATRLGVSPLLVGLTIVAWGTSAPELAFNLTAAFHDKPGLVFGNVVGANICNIGLIVGFCALLSPLVVGDSIVRRELPVMAGLLLLAAALGMTGTGGTGSARGSGFSRLDGAALLGLFLLYSAMTIHTGLRERGRHPDISGPTREAKAAAARRPLWLAIALFLVGLILLGTGGSLAAEGASGIAAAFNVSPTIVGLTIVAIGTTLPELMTCLIATRKGHVDLAMGNVVGSCIFNAACILGLCSTVAPGPLPQGGAIPLLTMLLLGALMLPMSRTFHRHVARVEGAVLLSIYAAFVAYQVYAATAGAAAPDPAGP